MFKEFEDREKQLFSLKSVGIISLSNVSPNANEVDFFTSIRSQGKINVIDINVPASFASGQTKEAKYIWEFKENKLIGQEYERKFTTGIYISEADLDYNPAISNNTSYISHQNLFNYQKGYLYRQDDLEGFDHSSTAMLQSGTSTEIAVSKFITIRRSLFKNSIDQNSIRIFMNKGLPALSGFVDGASANILDATNVTAFTSALDLKNSYAGDESIDKSFFFVPGIQSDINDQNAANHPAENIDNANESFTIEAIVRPIDKKGCIFFRRISSDIESGDLTNTKNNFIKLELAPSPDGQQNGFRFYIRNPDTKDDFSESFAQKDVQASGLFIPSEVGINLFDGNFHHIVASWSIYDTEGGTDTGKAAGAVLGYIDGYKLTNREQVNPRIGSSDSSGGPVIQANMINQRLPLKTTALNEPFSGHNIYIGVSNYNRDNGDVRGDHGDNAPISDESLEAGFDGQIQHMRIWSKRFTDGYTGIFDGQNKSVVNGSEMFYIFNNFRMDSLTADANLRAWWNFNELSALTATDIANQTFDPDVIGAGNDYSNTGTIFGNSSIRLYDSKDITTSNSANRIDTSLQEIIDTPRDFLYYDQVPVNKVIKNKLNQGSLIRNNIYGTPKRVGVVFYDLGTIIIDGQDTEAGIDFIDPVSGTTGDFGFSVTGNTTALNVERFSFAAAENKSKLILNATAKGNEYNYTFNPTGVDPLTDETITDTPITYITSVGLYNDDNELIAIAKLSEPIKKDDSSQITTQINLDF